MNRTKLWLVALFLITALTVSAQRKQCIDDDWRFFYGDGKAVVNNPSVADGWRVLALPHDWSVETEAAAKAGGRVVGPFSTNSVGGHQTGFTVGGEGWYQRSLQVSAQDLAGRVVLYFEGAYNHAWVYVNGTLCHENVYGYSSFRVDVTDRLHAGQNSIAVRVQNVGNNTRWYAGSGIYRHVWLLRTDNVHADEWDTYIRMDDSKWALQNGVADGQLCVDTRIHNEGARAARGSVCIDLLDAQGQTVASTQTAFSVGANSSQPATLSLPFAKLQPWSPEHPYLYNAVVSVKDINGKTTDSFSKRIGLRTLAFSATDGFRLNGVPTLLKGGCVHHDNGLLGAAAFDKAELRKLQLLKNLGYNAVRCSHNLPSEHFLDVCDELGLMVIDECFDQWLMAKNPDDYHNYFATHSDDDISVMLRRDRNHPSVIMWSIGNEIPGRIEPAGKAAAARLRADVLKYDTMRPVTAAICGWDAGDAWNSASSNWEVQDANAFESLDVAGYNYLYFLYERDHKTHPDRVMCGLESFPKQASENWNIVERLPYVIGDFVWTAMDYLGEAGIGAAFTDHAPSMFQEWPWFNGHCGDLDLIGQKKPQSYYRDVVWRQAPVTMAVQATPSQNNGWGWQLEEQHWTWPGLEGQNVSVNVYSRAPKVRLYLNGQSMGDKEPGNTFWVGYTIAYQPGTLRVVNLDAAGNERAGEEFVLSTTGPAVGVRCVYEDAQISDQLNDLAYVTLEVVDANGNVVTSDCSTQISIRNEGAGQLVACGTGSPNDMKSFRSTKPTVFRGRAQAIVRSDGKAGAVRLAADIVEKEVTFNSFFFQNADFADESLDGWTVSSPEYIRFNGSVWHDTELNGFLECFTGWGSATTLAGQSIAQSTKVLPAGRYTFSFDYNGTVRRGTSRYQTDGPLTGVSVSAGGTKMALTPIDADQAQHASLQFVLAEPKAVSFLIDFASGTNADWFALDNLNVTYDGAYDFRQSYTDKTAAVPAFGGSNWPKLSGNASAGYTEAKLGSALYNGTGLAYWSASAPRNADLFRQDITGLPEGCYGLAAFCAANRWSSSDNDRNHQPGTLFFARTDTGRESTEEVASATYQLQSVAIDVKAGEKLTMGIRAGATNGNNWCYLAGLTLVRLGNVGGADGIKQVAHQPFLSAAAQRGTKHVAYDLAGRLVQPSSATNGVYIVGGRKVLR